MTFMIEDTLRRILDFLTLGGPVVTILLVVSVTSLTLVILKIWQLLVARVGRHRTIEKALAHW
ncbi:MAG: MotA/TolQ/ExbB proton channel family protein, partial [Oricola sp.]|nr:MotA/TolQ/ExbB proton channel family protein [Oricola sp.]